MRKIAELPDSEPFRRVCADFHGEASIEIDMLEVRLGIHRAVRTKSDRDAILMNVAISSLMKHVEQYEQETGEKYPDYRAIMKWLENVNFKREGHNGANLGHTDGFTESAAPPQLPVFAHEVESEQT
jgi:hypothetical protein